MRPRRIEIACANEGDEIEVGHAGASQESGNLRQPLDPGRRAHSCGTPGGVAAEKRESHARQARAPQSDVTGWNLEPDPSACRRHRAHIAAARGRLDAPIELALAPVGAMRPGPVEELQHEHPRRVGRVEKDLGKKKVIRGDLQPVRIGDAVEKMLVEAWVKCGGVCVCSRRRRRREGREGPGVAENMLDGANWQSARDPGDVCGGRRCVEAVEPGNRWQGRNRRRAVEAGASENSIFVLGHRKRFDIERGIEGCTLVLAEDRHHLVPARTHLLQSQAQGGDRLMKREGEGVDGALQPIVGGVADVFRIGAEFGGRHARRALVRRRHGRHSDITISVGLQRQRLPERNVALQHLVDEVDIGHGRVGVFAGELNIGQVRPAADDRRSVCPGLLGVADQDVEWCYAGDVRPEKLQQIDEVGGRAMDRAALRTVTEFG